MKKILPDDDPRRIRRRRFWNTVKDIAVTVAGLLINKKSNKPKQ